MTQARPPSAPRRARPFVNLSRRLPVRREVDILIAGGGPAGIAAALTAARQGCSVALVEAQNCLGGMGTAGLVPAFMQFTDGVNFLAGGIGREILENLQRQDGVYPRDGRGIKAEVLKRVYDELLTRDGVKFVFHTQVVDVIKHNGRVQAVVCAGKSGLYAARARVFIDGTGDGDLAAYAGAPYAKGDAHGNLMPGTLCSLWSDINWTAVQKGGLGRAGRRIEEAIADGVFAVPDRHLPGIWPVGRRQGGGNIGHAFGVDGTDEESLTRAYIRSRRQLLEYERYYKEYLKGFERMELTATAPLMGIRETRRILGDYVLSVKDFKRRAVFADEIGRYSYPVDLHAARPDHKSFQKFSREIRSLRLGPGENYGIPYRILTPRGLKNVLAAGRCVSTDRRMQSSLRVMPGCYITGMAAGMAAAMMVETGRDCRAASIPDLQRRLQAAGAYLPNLCSA